MQIDRPIIVWHQAGIEAACLERSWLCDLDVSFGWEAAALSALFYYQNPEERVSKRLSSALIL